MQRGCVLLVDDRRRRLGERAIQCGEAYASSHATIPEGRPSRQILDERDASIEDERTDIRDLTRG